MDWLIDGGTDSDRVNDVSDGAFHGENHDFESSTDMLSSDMDTRAANQKHTSRRDSYKERRSKDNVRRTKEYRRESLKIKHKDVPSYEENSYRHKHKSNDSTYRTLYPARGVSDVSQYEGLSRTHSDPRLRDLRREHHKRSNSDKMRSISKVDDELAYYSSSSSVVSDVRSPELKDYSTNHSSGSHRHTLSPSSISPYQGREEKVRDSRRNVQI